MYLLLATGCGTPFLPVEAEEEEDDWGHFDEAGEEEDDYLDLPPDDSGARDTGDGHVDPPADTGIFEVLWSGGVQTADGERLDAGWFGFRYHGRVEDRELCRLDVTWAEGGAAPEGCPQCQWRFSPVASGGLSAAGERCDVARDVDADLDAFVFPIGFAEDYVYGAYYGYEVIIPTVVFAWMYERWTPFAWNYAGTYMITGDASDLGFARPTYEYGYYVP